ncbi:hypothetical protein DL765_011694 [Monosporascus sp. GIB2]|nr:hypothetical protein DL765_011694 [Monosporascus sp. GIB2]
MANDPDAPQYMTTIECLAMWLFADPKKPKPACKKRGCKRKQWKRPSRHAPGQDSLYCDKHTCVYEDKSSGGARCTNSAVSGGYCAGHTYCSVPNCNQRRTDPDVPFCRDFHQCIEAGCENVRRYSQTTNSYGPYCIDHACQEDSCRAAKRKNSDGCDTHTCKGQGCHIAVKGNSSDPNDADNFCAVHRRCKSSGCGDRVHDDPVNRAGVRCFRHYCASGATNCGEERLADAGATVCALHKCKMPGCLKSKNHIGGGGGGTYCKDHECAIDGCDEKRHGLRKHCAAHVCRAVFVDHVACDRPGDIDNNGRCPKHVECPESGCRKYRMIVNGNILAKCEDHLKDRCHQPGCGNVALAGSDACREHVCGLYGCRYPKQMPGDYCTSHKCTEPLCPNPRDAGLGDLGASLPAPLLLGLMNQLSAGGLNASLAVANAPASTLCSRHRCRARDCGQKPASDAALYCPRHECLEDECRNEVAKDSRFCQEHDEGAFGGAGYWGGGGGRSMYSGRWPINRKMVRW